MPNDLETLAADIDMNPAKVLMGLGGPALARVQRLARDGLLTELKDEVKLAFDQSIANTQLYDVISASRELIAVTARTAGMLSSSFGAVSNLFRQEISIVERLADFVNSEMFAHILDAIGMIPVVGWIVKIVADVAKMVAKMVTMVLDQKLSSAVFHAAAQLSVPMSGTKFNSEGDQYFVRKAFERMKNGAQQEFINPPYTGKRRDFEALGVYNDSDGGNWSGNRNKEMGVGWVVHPGLATGSTGFVPGTGNVSQALFFPAGVGPAPPKTSQGLVGKAGPMRDLGSLYPTGASVLNQWWSMVLKPGPSMFTVNPKDSIRKWENYVYELLVFGPDVLKGWTAAPTGKPFTNQFYCTEEMMDPYKKRNVGIGDCKKSKRGDLLTLPGNFGNAAHTQLIAYFYNLYFGLKRLTDREKNFNPDLGVGIPTAGKKRYYQDASGYKWLQPDSIDIDRSVPVRALDNLYDRQMATLKSINCMYVDGENLEKFSAFKNKALRRQWYESVTAIMSSTGWKQVVFADVPEGRMKNELRKLITRHKLDPEKLNAPCPPGAPLSHPCRQLRIRAAPTVLGSPELPPPPGAVQVPQARMTAAQADAAKAKRGKRKKKSQSGTIIAAAAVAGLLLLKK